MSHEQNPMMQILETIADRLVDMHLSNNRQFDELKALMAVRAGDQLTLLAMVAAGPASVVPNEDEAMPVVEEKIVLACCPTCNHTVYDEYDVEQDFGYRTPAGRETIVQSWCRECRKLEQATSPRKLVRAKMPADIKALSTEATRLAHEGRTMIEEASAIIAASTGHVSKEALQKMKDGEAKLERSAALKSEYGKFQKASIKARRNSK